MPKITEVAREVRWSGSRFDVIRGIFRHDDGKQVLREWTSPGNVVAVLPFDGSYFYLGRQPREVAGGYQLGLCAGKIDDGEDPLTAAKRELLEEFGLEPQHWTDWGTFYSSEGITDEQCTLYLASGISRWSSAHLDADERVDVVKVPLQYLLPAIEKVTNAKAKIALLKLYQKESTKIANRSQLDLCDLVEQYEWMSGADAQDYPPFDFGV